MMACCWVTLRCARFSNLICHRWHQQQRHQLFDSILNRKDINGFQYIAFVKHIFTISDVKPARRKTERIPKITLYLDNDRVIVTEIEAAQKLAKRRMLILTKVKDDSKADRPVYKLVSTHDLTEDLEEVKDSEDDDFKKSEKTVWIGEKIDRHDFEIKMKKMQTMLGKRFKCKIMKKCLDTEDVGKTTEIIKEALKEFGKVTKVENKKTVLKISITPLPKVTESGEEH